MTIEKAIEVLEKYIALDRSLRDECVSDFDKFCEEKCVAIETLINTIEKLEKKFWEYKEKEGYKKLKG
jgi:ATP-dependent Clp protease ATP-binding subunit ClpA